jgi:F-type H+-transporting ATPase subunit b
MIESISWLNLLSQWITFLIMLAIVWKFGWKPMVKFMNDRSEKVRKTLDEAENAKQSIAKLEADYRAKIEQMEQKSAELVAQARSEAARAKEEIVKAAHQEAAEQQKKSRDQLEADRRRVMGEMRAEVVALAMAVVEKALHEPVAGGVHDRKYQEILDELSSGQQRRPS